MAWPDHPYISCYLVVRNPSEREKAARAIACFLFQKWPVKQLVIINGTAVPFSIKGCKELMLHGTSLGSLKNAAIMAADGEWCFNWDINCWYSPDYLTFMMSGTAPCGATLIRNPIVVSESGEHGHVRPKPVETTAERVAFFGFFKVLKAVPLYDEDGSDTAFIKKFGSVRWIDHVEMAKRFVSESEIFAYDTPLSRAVPVKKGSVCVVQLGRYGDITNVLPICLHIFNSYQKPYMMVSREFLPILDGVSYVEPFPVDLYCDQVLDGMAIAKANFEHVIQTQIWGRGYTQEKLTDSYNREMWRMGGFLKEFENEAWQPYFDQPNPPDEAFALLDGRPLILTNLTCGASSPFPAGAQILKMVEERYGKDYQVLDVGPIRLKRVYDLEHLIRQAKVVVSIDTVLLHLVAGKKTPVVALVQSSQPWLGSVCRGHTVARMNYAQVEANPRLVIEGVEKALKAGEGPPWVGMGVARDRQERRIFHLVATYEEPNPAERKRKKFATDSWAEMYAQGVIPCYYTDWKRWGQHLGAKTKLPFLKDCLEVALKAARSNDIILYTNDDIICHPDLPNQLRFYCGVFGAVAGRRCEIAFPPPPPLTASPHEWAAQNRNEMFTHEGRDMFAFTKRWLQAHWDELPDFYIGSTEWDNCVVIMIRRERGITSAIRDLKPMIWPAEMPLGWTAHVRHRSFWQSPVNFDKSPANIHNRSIFKEWAKKYAPHLTFTEDNQLIEIR